MSEKNSFTSIFEDLKFDEMEIDTTLAKSFVEKHKLKFQSLKICENFSIEDYMADNNQTCWQGRHSYDFHLEDEDHIVDCDVNQNTVDGKNVRDLAEKVKENAKLFAQLEYLIKKTSYDEIMRCDIELIVRNLMFCSSRICSSEKPKHGYIRMHSEEPLASLGFVAQILMNGHRCVIFAEKDTVAVCYLFTQLCQELHLPVTMAQFLTNKPFEHSFHMTGTGQINKHVGSGIGVITEKCDMDSSIHALINSTSRKPWSLGKILVQENVYPLFKEQLNSLTKVKRTDNNRDTEKWSAKCDQAFSIRDKIFLLDYAGTEEELEIKRSGVIFVEAYRTVKELLSMMKQLKCFCLSLWCEDMSLANEISLNGDAPITWVNDVGIFAGPPATALAYYGQVDIRLNADHYFKPKYYSLCDIAEKVKLELNQTTKEFDCILDAIIKRATDANTGFVHLENGKMCIGIPQPVGTLVLGKSVSDELVIEALLSTTFGNSLLSYQSSKPILSAFLKEGAPVVFSINRETLLVYKYKIIWSNYGTIFAN